MSAGQNGQGEITLTGLDGNILQVTPVAASFTNVSQLVADVNAWMSVAGVSSTVTAGVNSQGEITFTDTYGNPLVVGAVSGDPAATQLFLPTSVLAGSQAAPANGRLSADTTFLLVDGTAPAVQVTATATSTAGDQNATNLANVISTAIQTAESAAGVTGVAVTVGVNGSGDLTFTDQNGNPLRISGSTNNQLGLPFTPLGISLREAIAWLETQAGQPGAQFNFDPTTLIQVAQDLSTAAANDAPASGDSAATTVAKATNLTSAMIAAAGSLSDAVSTLPGQFMREPRQRDD